MTGPRHMAQGRVTPRRVTRLASVQLAPNPGPMTLDGTNSYVLRAASAGSGANDEADAADGAEAGSEANEEAGAAVGADAPSVVVDPGPDHAEHLGALAAAGPVELILITHQHSDHTEGIETLHRLTGAPVRAVLPEFCRGAAPLADGERIVAGGVEIVVVATPGHTADSVCFHLPDDGPAGPAGTDKPDSPAGPDSPSSPISAAVGDGDIDTSTTATTSMTASTAGAGSVLTGDTVLGRGSTVIGIPDGTLRQYLDSLRRIAGLGLCHGLPAHGPDMPDLAAVCATYIAHREQRLDQVRAALLQLGSTAAEMANETGVTTVTNIVYHDVDPAVRFAALYSVAAQLEYLSGE